MFICKTILTMSICVIEIGSREMSYKWENIGQDDDDLDIDIIVEYDSEYYPAERDVGIMSAGYAVKIYGATIEETGKPYSYSSEEEDKWCNAIAEELGDYRNEN